MTPDLDPQAAPLFVEVSETEQEQIAGGCGFGGWHFLYFDQTNIETYAGNDTDFSGTGSDGGPNAVSTSSRSAYRLSRTTLAFGGGSFGRCRSYFGASRWGGFMKPYMPSASSQWGQRL